MSVPTIRCKYSCALCGLHRAEVALPERTPEQTVLQWMDDVVRPGLVRDHERRSPGCRPDRLTELMIPMQGRKDVGGPIVQ